MNFVNVYSIAATQKPELPGAAIITRNIISYDEPHGKTSRASRRKNTETEEDFNVNTSVNVKTNNMSRVVHVKHNSIHSNNASTLIGTQERDRVKEEDHERGMKYEPRNKKEDIDNLLQELDVEDSGMNFGKLPVKKHESAIRIVHNQRADEKFEFAEPEESEHESPVKNFNHNKLPFGDDEEEGFNYGFDNPTSGIINFVANEDPEPQRDDFGYGMLDEEEDNFRPSANKKKVNNYDDDEDESPKQFALDDLLDDNFDAGKKHDAIQTKPKNRNPTEDDLLAEFEW